MSHIQFMIDVFTGKDLTLPNEILSKIFSYMSSHSAMIIRQSKFYQKSFPFFHLTHVLSYDVTSTLLCEDIRKLNREIYMERIKQTTPYPYWMMVNQDDLDILMDEMSDYTDEEDFD
jgi:hypothetical protein